MYADRYQSGKVNPGSLSLSVGIVGGLIAAAMLSNTVVEVIERSKPLKTYIVPPVAPPPPVDKPLPKTETRQPVPTAPKPVVAVPTEPEQLYVPPPEPGPIANPGTNAGTGTATTVVVDPPKPPAPVLTRADVDPRYARDFQPTYPAQEQRAGNEGVVSLRVLIGVDGRVRQVEQISSPSEAFWRATEQRALGKWRFKPATRDGVAYESWKTMTVRFRLAEA